MNGNFLLDTNIVIALFNNDINIISQLDNAESISIPSIVVGELFYGAYNSKKVNENISKIKEFCNEVEIISCDLMTAEFYGQIKKILKEMSKQIPDNDIWIAAISKQHNICLVSRDKHFEYISSLNLQKW